ncbi:MAG: undecaprenyl-diphosphate phosphatase [Pseudomonadota bacterium]
MDILQIVVLAIVQGITEFLPISSSAHLILVPVLTGWQDQGLLMDVAVHVGTLLAVIVYFRRDVLRLIKGGSQVLGLRYGPDARLALQIVVATIPVVIAGFLMKDLIATELRSTTLIIATTAGFGVLLALADWRARTARGSMPDLGWREVIVIGLAQVLALIPGVSRSGITITAALFLGLRRTEAARFSLLLSIPTILGAGTLAGLELVRSGDAALQIDAVLAAGLAFVSALAAITAMMAWLKQASYMPFVVYRLLLAAFLVLLVVLGLIGG